MNKTFIVTLILILVSDSLFAQKQINDNQVYTNNLTALQTISNSWDSTGGSFYEQIIPLVDLCAINIEEYSSINVNVEEYRENFGDFELKGYKHPFTRVIKYSGKIQFAKTVYSISDKRLIALHFKNDPYEDIDTRLESVVLAYEKDKPTNQFYNTKGQSVDYQVKLDNRGRIIEFFGGPNLIVKYSEGNKISSITEQENYRRSASDNTGVMRMVNSIEFKWHGNSITAIIVNNRGGEEVLNYYLEVTEKDENGLWKEAILYHIDETQIDNKFYDWKFSRCFVK